MSKLKRQADAGTSYLPLFMVWGMAFGPVNRSGQAVADCPFCGKPRHFYVNAETGQWNCKLCGEKGNAYTFINMKHREALAATTNSDHKRLSILRRLPAATLKRNGLAWDEELGCWLVPAKSAEGRVQNLLRWYEDGRKPLSLPVLPLRPFGREQLSNDPARTLIIYEGPWDFTAGKHYASSKKVPGRFDGLGYPGANSCKREWVKDVKPGQKVCVAFDNDEAGRKGQERIVKIFREQKVVCDLRVMDWPKGMKVGCDVRDLLLDGVHVLDFIQKHCKKVSAGGPGVLFQRGDAIAAELVQWLSQGKILRAILASLSGKMGEGKSLLVRYMAACLTAGLPMFGGTDAVPPCNVIYFTSEDSAARVRDLVELHGGDLSRLFVHDIAAGPEPIDLLENIEQIEAAINEHKAALVIIDALNSFVGGDISTDSKARRTLSGRLQALARRTGACVLGVRNWGRAEGGTAYQKVMGAASLSDVARCVMNTLELPREKDGPRQFLLQFEKVSDAPKPTDLAYTIENLSTGPGDSWKRRIRWTPKIDGRKLIRALKAKAKKVAGKGSGRVHADIARGKRKGE